MLVVEKKDRKKKTERKSEKKDRKRKTRRKASREEKIEHLQFGKEMATNETTEPVVISSEDIQKVWI